jgi:hypothetical protein
VNFNYDALSITFDDWGRRRTTNFFSPGIKTLLRMTKIDLTRSPMRGDEENRRHWAADA